MDKPELVDKELERVALSIGIPPCPAILLDLSAETKKEMPDFAKIEALIGKDVGLSATLLKTVNSPFYGLSSKISTTKQAIAMLGLSMLSRTITGLVLRQAFVSKDAVSMERFWDASARIAIAASFIAKALRGLNKDEAYTFGLFQNCGIPILMQRFPTYKDTLGNANNATDLKFTDVEDQAHGTDHATMGYLLTKSWNLPDTLSQAIRFHHEYAVLDGKQIGLTEESQGLIAVGLLADHLVASHTGKNFSVEWTKGGALAMSFIGISEGELEDIYEDNKHLLE